MAEESPRNVMLRDPLSTVTRKERQYLLGVSILGITLVKTGLVPSKISALGIEFAKTDQQSLMTIIGLVTLYFLGAFVIYAASDFLAWRLAFIESVRKVLAERRKQRKLSEDQIRDEEEHMYGYMAQRRVVFALSGPVSIIRALFEFGLPLFVGIYAVFTLWTAEVPQAGT